MKEPDIYGPNTSYTSRSDVSSFRGRSSLTSVSVGPSDSYSCKVLFLLPADGMCLPADSASHQKEAHVEHELLLDLDPFPPTDGGKS